LVRALAEVIIKLKVAEVFFTGGDCRWAKKERAW